MEEKNLNQHKEDVENNSDVHGESVENSIDEQYEDNVEEVDKQNDDHSLENDSEESDKTDSKSGGKGFSLSNDVNFGSALIWGVSGFVFAIVLVLLVSLISGTLQFVLGRLFIFGILFFVVGALIRIVIDVFAPEVFNSKYSYDEDSTSEYDYDKEIPIEMDYSSTDLGEDLGGSVGKNIDASIDDKIDTDPLFKSEDNVNEQVKKKYGGYKDDFIEVEGTDVVLPNNAEVMAESIRTMISRDED